jgi:hypothetical protein
MNKIKTQILALAILLFGLNSCSKNSGTDPTPVVNPKDTTNNGGGGGGGNTETGINLNPDFSFFFKGTKIEFSKVQADYGGKTYFTGFDKSQRFVLDMTIPVAKGVLATNKTFTLENDQYTGMGIFIDAIDQKWFLEGGTINVTKNSASILSGNFSCKAILIDFSEPLNPKRTDSADITKGVFNNLRVKG